MDWRDELLSEKSFLQVYKRSVGVVGARFNRISAVILFVSVIIFAFVNFIILAKPIISLDQLATEIRSWASTGVQISSSILGFLIVGFALFASITRPALFVALAKTPHDKDRKDSISELKFIYFNFLLIFLHYFVFLVFCLIITLFSGETGILNLLLFRLVSEFAELDFLPSVLTSLGAATLAAWFSLIVLLLKSFLWNLYQSILIAITSHGLIPEEIEENNK